MRNLFAHKGGEMTDTVQVAIISAAGSVTVALTALILNARWFTSLERRIELIEQDLKQFFRSQADFDKRLALLEKREPHQ
jgi:hypothetical protein